MSDKLHLVYATDNVYLMPTKVSAVSAVVHASCPERLVIDILDCGLDDDDWNELATALHKAGPVDVCRFAIDLDHFAQMPAYRGGRGNYARFEIPNLLQDVDWCVYADGDTLFLGDVFELWKFRDDSFALLGHRDVGCDGARQSLYQHFGWTGDVTKDCVCSGFLLMNLNWFRVQRAAHGLADLLERAKGLPFYDQDALNVFCQGVTGFLPPEWGVFNIESFSSGRIPKCIHYAFGKPWNLSVMWTRCLIDADRLWFHAAKKYCDIGFREAGTTWRQYFQRWYRSVAHRIFLAVVCRTKKGRVRWGGQLRYYSPVALPVIENSRETGRRALGSTGTDPLV